MIGILITLLVAALAYPLLVALTGSAIVGIVGRDSDPARRHPERRLRLRKPLGGNAPAASRRSSGPADGPPWRPAVTRSRRRASTVRRRGLCADSEPCGR